MAHKEQNIFTQDIEVPEVVQEKADAAFLKIRMEEINRIDKTATKYEIQEYKKKRYSFKNPAAVAACICILTIGSITAIAAVYRHWSRGMQGNLQASFEQQNELVENGTTTFISTEEDDYASMAVTSGDVTIKPLETIVDGHFAHLSFSVEGYTLAENAEPCFETVTVYTGNDPNDENAWVNMSGSFYDGIVPDNNGNPVYDNGNPLEFREDGSIISYYTAEDGTLEYIMTLHTPDIQESLLGKTVHVEFENLGTVYKTEYENALDGIWAFDIPLSGNDTAKTYSPKAELGDSGAIVKTVELSPISIRLSYDYQGSAYEEPVIDENGNETTTTLYTEPPQLLGVRLKDGTMLKYLTNGGSMGYTDESYTEYSALFAFDRVIDADHVEALLFKKTAPDGESELTEENLYIMPLQ